MLTSADFAVAVGLRLRGLNDPGAIAAFEVARSLGDRSYAVAHHLADCHLRAEVWRNALTLYQEAARHPGAEVWTFVNGAKAAVAVGAFRAAFDLLRSGVGTVSGEPVWRDAVHTTVEAWFAARSKRARALYALQGGRARADALVTKLVDQASRLWTSLDPLGAPIGASPQGKVIILAGFDVRVCVHYRVEQKEELLELLGQPYEVYRADQWREFIAALPGAATAIFFRMPAWPTVSRAIEAARRMGVPTYYEIDDLIFDSHEYPDTLESYGGLLSWEDYEAILFGVPLFRYAVSLCDYGVASTPPLAKAMEPLVRSGRVFWLPNGLDSRNEHYLFAPPARVRNDDAIWIAYASGTKAHNTDFNELAGPALLDVLKAHPEVRLLLVGYLALDKSFDAVRRQIIRYDYVNNSESFWSMLADADLSLAVLKPTWATNSKSEIKWLEAAVMGIPSVVSDTAVYLEVVEDGRDAIVARTVDEWRAGIERLVSDRQLRLDMGQRARDKAAERYSLAANAARLRSLLAPALESRRPVRPVRGKKRILLGNVWFPPQTIGGATRVVRNNLDTWLDQGLGEEFDFAVVATDNNAAPAHRVRVEDYRGVPVMRIATPMQANMDWRPEDHEVRRIFSDLIDTWRPDMVHFHAVQRLTASVLQACQRVGLPYLATVHDAWWLSDWHFLVDDAGRIHQPCPALPTHPPEGISVSQSLDRRRVLHAALDGAEAVLGVSDSFAELYRSCGYRNVLSVPNGAPPLKAAERTRSTSGRVRLLHVGNITAHKGFRLIEAALRQSRFSNVELTAIDHSRSAGFEERSLLGATPVRIIGKVPQEEVHTLYAQNDVLLAPSIWPESYGLVAREALASGLWVVASNLGAMGDDVQPGENGFVVDVSTVEELLAALNQIDGDPGRYLDSPTVRPALRSADQQAQEVMALYRRVLSGEKLFPGARNTRLPFAGTVMTEPGAPELRKTPYAARRAQRLQAQV